MKMEDAKIANELVIAMKETKEHISRCSRVIAKQQAEMVEYAKRLAIIEKDLESL